MFFAATMISIEPVYEQVDVADNPAEHGLYERVDNNYVPTQDTKPTPRKIYYKTDGAEIKDGTERRIVFNTDDIKYMMENHGVPDTTIVFVRDGKPTIIKGTFEENSKILLGFNRK